MIDITIDRGLPPLIVKVGDPHTADMAVYFNGSLSDHFMYVNQIKGYGKRYKTRPDGRYIKNGDEFSIEKVYGKLEIKWRNETPRSILIYILQGTI